MKKTIIITIMLILFLPIVLAEQETLGTYKKGSCINLLQSCANCSYNNFTSVSYPDGTLEILNINASRNGSIFFTSFCNTTQIGDYAIHGLTDVDGTETEYGYRFEVNQEGSKYSIYLIYLLVIAFLYIILGIGIAKEDTTFIALSSMGIIIVSIYSFYNGIGNWKNMLTNAFAIINFGLGIYIFLMATINEAMEQM